MNDARSNARQFVGEDEDDNEKVDNTNNNNNTKRNSRSRSKQRSRSTSRGTDCCTMIIDWIILLFLSFQIIVSQKLNDVVHQHFPLHHDHAVRKLKDLILNNSRTYF